VWKNKRYHVKKHNFLICIICILFSSLANSLNTKTIYGNEYPYFSIYTNNSKTLSDHYKISCGDISDNKSEQINCFIDHIQFLKNDDVCNITSFSTKEVVFKYNSNYNKWIFQEEPKFICGLVEYYSLEKDNINAPYWNYLVERKVINGNAKFMDSTCSKVFIKQSIASNKHPDSFEKIPIKCTYLTLN